MKAPILFAFLAFSLFGLAAQPVQQPAQKARIEGSVVRAGTGEAVARARITLTRARGGANAPRGAQPAPIIVAPPPGAPAGAPVRGAAPPPLPPIPSIDTDDQGRFAIPDLDEGSYTMQILANGYVNQNYGQRYANGPGIPIALKAGDTKRDLNITMTPASNLSGRIRDTNDQPIANVPVQLLRYTYNAQGVRSFQAVGNAKTDDRGDYRVFWMTPGRYILMAGNASGGSSLLATLVGLEGGGNPNDLPLLFGVAYYPGVSDIGAAQAINLPPGADLDSVNLVLPPKPQTYRIRGRVVDSRTGKPPAQARVTATSQTQAPGGAGISDLLALELPLNKYDAATGAFEVRDLAPGNYTVNAVVQDAPDSGIRSSITGPAGAQQVGGSTVVGVAGSDVNDVTITVAPAVSISGRVRADGGTAINLNCVRLQLAKRDAQPNSIAALLGGNNLNTVAGTDGSFTMANVTPGEYRITMNASCAILPPGSRPGANTTYLKEVRYDNTDVLNGPLRVTGSAAGVLDITIGVGGGQISGTLTDNKNMPAAVSQVVLVPDRGGDRIELYRTATTDENGKFAFNGVIPAEYKVYAWEGLEPFSWFDPALIAQSENKGKAVHVTDASSDTIEIRQISKDGQ